MDRETERYAEPEGIPTRLAKQFGLVFLCGVVVSAVCIVIGFLLGYNARPSKSRAMEIPQTLTNSRPPASSAFIPSAPAPTAANSAPSTGPDSGSTKPKESVSASSSTTTTQNSAPSATASQGGSRTIRSETTTASGSAAYSGGKATDNGVKNLASPAGSFVVQVGSRHAKDETAQLDRILRNLGYSLLPFVLEKVAGVDSYRVQVGPFASRELADKATQKLELEGFQPFVFPAPEATVKALESPPAPSNGKRQASSLSGSTASPKTPTRSGQKAPEAEGPTGIAPLPEPKLPAVSALPSPQAAPARIPPPSGSAQSLQQSTQQSTSQQAANGRGGKVVDQVLASTSEADVIEKVKLLEGQGFRAFVESPRAGEKMFRALVGPFDSILEAEEAGRKLSASGTKPYIRSWRSAQAE